MMTHMNIQIPDFRTDHYRTIALLKAELEYEKSRTAHWEDQLRSLAERVVAGEEVYLCLDNGETVHVIAKPEDAKE